MRARGVVALLFLLGAAPICAEKIRNHFDADGPWRAPGFFEFAVLGAPGPAQWIVIPDQNPPSAPNSLLQAVAKRPADSVAAAVRKNCLFRDGKLTVGVKRGSGRGGVVFRVSSEKDFLLLLVDLATGEVHLASYKEARPSRLASGKAEFPQEWSILSVTASGASVSVHWNEKKLFEGVDPNPASGKAGLATAGDGSVSFDEFVLEPQDAGSR